MAQFGSAHGFNQEEFKSSPQTKNRLIGPSSVGQSGWPATGYPMVRVREGPPKTYLWSGSSAIERASLSRQVEVRVLPDRHLCPVRLCRVRSKILVWWFNGLRWYHHQKGEVYRFFNWQYRIWYHNLPCNVIS